MNGSERSKFDAREAKAGVKAEPEAGAGATKASSAREPPVTTGPLICQSVKVADARG